MLYLTCPQPANGWLAGRDSTPIAACLLSIGVMLSVVNLTKSKVKAMKKQDLRDLCIRLEVDVEGCKVKADYVAKVLAYLQHSGASASATGKGAADAQEAAKPKVCVLQCRLVKRCRTALP